MIDSMSRDEALRQLARSLPELQRDFGVARAGVFGSVARNEAREGSDVDVIVEFSRAPNFAGFEALKARLAALFGQRVDLVTPDSLHRLVRRRALAEAVYAEA